MNALQKLIRRHPFGGITTADLPELLALDRLHPVLVICGCCRFTCAAQNLEHMIACVQKGGDYVRYLSFPVGSFERAATWQGTATTTEPTTPPPTNNPNGRRPSWSMFEEEPDL